MNHDDNSIERCTADSKYCIIPNEIAQHPTMSADARCVLIYLLSCKADWRVTPRSVWKALPLSRDQVYAAFNELIKLGYMCRVTNRNGNLKSSVTYKVAYFKKFLRHPESRDTEDQDAYISNIDNNTASPKGEAVGGEAPSPQQKKSAAARQSSVLSSELVPEPEVESEVEPKVRTTGCPAPAGSFDASSDADRVDSLEDQKRDWLRGHLEQDGCDEDFIRELFATYSLDDICRSAAYVAARKATNFPGMLRSSLVDGYGPARGKLPPGWKSDSKASHAVLNGWEVWKAHGAEITQGRPVSVRSEASSASDEKLRRAAAAEIDQLKALAASVLPFDGWHVTPIGIEKGNLCLMWHQEGLREWLEKLRDK